MEENIMTNNELVEKAYDKLIDAADNMDKAVALGQPTTLPTQTTSTPNSDVGKTLLINGGVFLGGIAVGAAIDHWAVPKLKKAIDNHKEKKAKKKAEKEAKKAAKDKKNSNEKPEAKKNEPAASEKPAEVDPTTIDTKID